MSFRWLPILVATLGSWATVACSPSDQSFSLKQGLSEPTYEYVRVDRDYYQRVLAGTDTFNRDHAYHPEYVVGYLNTVASMRAKATGQVVAINEEEVRHGLRDPFSLEPTKDWGILDEEDFEDYHNYDELTAELESITAAHPQLATLETAGQSVEGRELWYVKIAAEAAVAEGRPKLLYIANMHGDEVVGRELMIYLLRVLTEGAELDPRLENLVNQAQIYIMPTMNPDGFENRRRSNARGYDLNRDFPDFTTDPDDTQSGRQPETQAVMALHRDHHFVTALNFHGGEVCVNMPWDTTSNRTESERFGDDPLMQQLARDYADKNPTMRDNDRGPFDRGVTYGYEWYEVDGGLQDWANYYRRSIHATLELSYSKWPAASQLQGFWEENKESLVGYLEASLHGFHLRVVDENGQLIPGVSVSHDDANRAITYDSGLIHRPANAGVHRITVSKPGFESFSEDLETAAFDGEYVTITLSETLTP